MAYHLTIPQAVYLLRQQGLSPQAAAIGAAVMIPESGGNSLSVGDSGQSKGPWQVYRPAHPDVNQTRLQNDPHYAAQITASISNHGRDWSPWTGYKTGAYRKYLPAAQRAARTGGAPMGPQGARTPGAPGFTAPGSATVSRTVAPAQTADMSGVMALAQQLQKPEPYPASPPQPPSFSAGPRLAGGGIGTLPLTPPPSQRSSIESALMDVLSKQGMDTPLNVMSSASTNIKVPGQPGTGGGALPRGGRNGWQTFNRKGTGPNPRLVAFGHYLQSRGFRVAEHPAFGGVAPVHHHYGAPDHYHGGALDITGKNMGVIPALVRTWVARGWLQKRGPGVLWQVPGHYDHVHVSAA